MLCRHTQMLSGTSTARAIARSNTLGGMVSAQPSLHPNDCVFCAIIDGTAPAAVVFEDAQLIAFLDRCPISEGHTLVVPKRHVARLGELDEATAAHMFTVGQRLVAAALSGFGVDGANLVLNDGSAAFQTVDHVHLHMIPRSSDDRRSILHRVLRRRERNSDLAAATLRDALDS